MSRADRFWAKVDRSGDCWTWEASMLRNGYGQFERGGLAHRVAYELTNGPIEAGRQIDHLCRNRRCVNPAHLEPVTQRENILRGRSLFADHARQTACGKGHPFDEANTRTIFERGRPNARRQCRACDRDRARVRRATA